MCFSIPIIKADVQFITILPDNPIQGDLLKVTLKAEPNDEIPIILTSKASLPVIDGEYILDLKQIYVPQLPNTFTVTATGVKDLSISVKILIWITKSATAKDGVATVNQGNVPPGKYYVSIEGEALPGVSVVELKISARTVITTDNNGLYEIDYETNNLPHGSLNIKAGSMSQDIELKPRQGNQLPIPIIKAEKTVQSGIPATFDGSKSYDPDGFIVDYLWNFGDGQYGYGNIVSHSYNVTGVFQIDLSVKDNLNSITWSTVNVDVIDTYSIILDTFFINQLIVLCLLSSLMIYFSNKK